MTAYFGLLHIGRLVEGETVVVSGAAGGVGTAVGQIAKLKGARAVGIAGGLERCRMFVEELGFDGAIDYERRDLLDQRYGSTLRTASTFRASAAGSVLAIVGRLSAVSAAPEAQIAAFVRLSRAVGGVSALSTELAGSYYTALEADGVEPVGRRVDTAPSEGRADVR